MVEEYKLDWLEKRCKKQLNIFNDDGKVVLSSDDCKIILELIKKYKEAKNNE